MADLMAKVKQRISAVNLPGGGGSGGASGIAASYAGFAGSAPALPLPSVATRPFRRLYIGSIPPGTTSDQLNKFFDETIQRAGYPGTHCVPNACGEVGDKAFAFIEFYTLEMCAAVVGLNGITFNGRALKITRPRDWKAELQPQLAANIVLSPKELGILPRTVEEGPHKVFIGGIPTYFNEEALKDFLQCFGKLKSMNLVRDPGAPMNKGFAFFEFEDHSHTAIAVSKLNGYQLELGKPPVSNNTHHFSGSHTQLSLPPTHLYPLLSPPKITPPISIYSLL